jgi:translation initiation factor IF-3
VGLDDGLAMAQEKGFDLVEVSPGAKPPVVKMMDYGKYKYEQQKKAAEARKRQKVIEIKEIKMRPGIDVHDYEVKMKAMKRFFDEGDKVKVTLRFRGREMAHQHIGMELLTIKAALDARGDKRTTVLVPESAHGTNPATAALLGYRVIDVPARADGTVDPEAVRERLAPNVAAIMLTNPNTCGLFERDVVAIADAVHAVGAYFYADGANFNAIVGKVKPGDLGVDAMHINLHKTFSTPHGGGGPGAGAGGLSE